MVDEEQFIEAVRVKTKYINSRLSTSYRETCIEKVILQLLDKYKTGKFNGIFSVKIKEEQVFLPRLNDVIEPTDFDYKDFDK